jgi:hypothetical protein
MNGMRAGNNILNIVVQHQRHLGVVGSSTQSRSVQAIDTVQQLDSANGQLVGNLLLPSGASPYTLDWPQNHVETILRTLLY